MSTSDTTTTVKTRTCLNCGETGWLELPSEGLRLYNQGAFVQVAFKDVSPEFREQFISGIHPKCWDALFGTDTEPGQGFINE